MRYCEKKINDNVDNPIDMIKLIILMIVFAPYRLISEVSKKILLLGEYSKKFLLTLIGFNTLLIVLSLIQTIMFTKVFVIVRGFLPLTALILSELLCIGFYFIIDKFRYPVDLDRLENIEVEKSMDSALNNISNVHKSSSSTSTNTTSEDDLVIEDEIELHKEKPKTKDDIIDVIHSDKKKDLDSVYSLDKASSLADKLEALQSSCLTSGAVDVNTPATNISSKKTLEDLLSKVKSSSDKSNRNTMDMLNESISTRVLDEDNTDTEVYLPDFGYEN
ncbi:MAG: hypothetical protein ACRC5M_07265 [Anaeroplasmataceae bacterium]